MNKKELKQLRKFKKRFNIGKKEYKDIKLGRKTERAPAEMVNLRPRPLAVAIARIVRG